MPHLTSAASALKLLAQHPKWFHPSSRVSEAAPWPAGFDPKKAPVYARNEAYIAAPPSTVFSVLRNAEAWPTLYPNSRDVQVEGGGPLELGSRFSWTTFGTRQHSEVKELVPDQVFAFSAKGGGADTYHRWFLKPEGAGTRLVTEEIEQGAVPKALSPFMNRALFASHERWVQGVKAAAEAASTFEPAQS